MRGRVNAIRTFKGLVADLRYKRNKEEETYIEGLKLWYMHYKVYGYQHPIGRNIAYKQI